MLKEKSNTFATVVAEESNSFTRKRPGESTWMRWGASGEAWEQGRLGLSKYMGGQGYKSRTKTSEKCNTAAYYVSEEKCDAKLEA